jgi:hypothetical protein
VRPTTGKRDFLLTPISPRHGLGRLPEGVVTFTAVDYRLCCQSQLARFHAGLVQDIQQGFNRCLGHAILLIYPYRYTYV